METPKGLYIPKRGESFKKMIVDILQNAKIGKKYIDILSSEESMWHYNCAFTSDTVDEVNNYQVFEQLGDLSANKFIVCYIYDRFPQLKCPEGVKVVARLKINYGSKNTFCVIAERLGFWEFISSTLDVRQREKKSLLEDTFEAFLGATENILDLSTKIGVGYACVYRILKSIFDTIPISLKYEDLYDGKTRLKELFDMVGDELGSLVYEDSKEGLLATSKVLRKKGENKIFIAQGSGSLKADAQQKASQNALVVLESQGYVKKPPFIYSKLSGEKEKNKVGEKDILRFCDTKERINEQCFTKGKGKTTVKYTSPPIHYFIKRRNLEGINICLDMGATLDTVDSEGSTILDLLFIGKYEKDLVFTIFERLLTGTLDFTPLKIHSNIYHTYYAKYGSLKIFKDQQRNIQII